MVYQYLAEFGGLIQVVAILALILTYRLAKTHLTIDLLKTLLTQNTPLDILSADSFGKIFIEKRTAISQGISHNNQGFKFTQIVPKEDLYGGNANNIGSALKKANLKGSKPTPSLKVKKRMLVPNQIEDAPRLDPEASSYRMRLSDSVRSERQQHGLVKNIVAHVMPVGYRDSEPSLPDEPNLKKTPSESSISNWHMNQEIPPLIKKEKEDPLPSHHLRKASQTLPRNPDRIQMPNHSNNTKEAEGSIAYLCLFKKALLKQKLNLIKTLDLVRYSLWPCCAQNAPVNQAISFANSQIESKFDMTRLLKTMTDFEKLLSIVLTPEQRLLFDLIPAGVFHDMPTSQKGFPESSKVLSHEEKVAGLQDARKVLEIICQSPEPTLIDKNLLGHLGFLLDLDLRT